MQFHKLEVFSYCPFFFVEVWIDIVVPSFTTLLANSTRKKCSDFLPLLQAVLCNLLFEDHVFLWSPVAFNLLNSAIFGVVPQNKPPVHAFDFSFRYSKQIWVISVHVFSSAINELVELFVHDVNIVHFKVRHQLDQEIVLYNAFKIKSVRTYLLLSPFFFLLGYDFLD